MKKILTIVGTRPELIRLAVIIAKLDERTKHVLVYTNQNFDPNLSTIFFKDLDIRKPDYYLDSQPTKGAFIGMGMIAMEAILLEEKPDKVLVLGDTNSCLLAIMAAKMGIPIFHMEAGNRCYDNMVPEECNRRILDSIATVNMPYTENSKQNLINEGFHKNRVFKIGNPINEVLNHYMGRVNESDILKRIGLSSWEDESDSSHLPFALLSFHRTENVDNLKRCKKVIEAMNEVAKEMAVVFPVHPRTQDKLGKLGFIFEGNWILTDPLGFFDFGRLEKAANIVFTDSGTVPEELFLFHGKTIVLRDTTERQELIEHGSMLLAGTETRDILEAYDLYRNKPNLRQFNADLDYTCTNVSETVISLLIGLDLCSERRGHDEY